MGSKRSHENYLYVDQGLRADGTPMRVAVELPNFTCCHCMAVVIMNAGRSRPRGYCARCDHWTCDKPVCATECHPIMAGLELAQRYPDAAQPFLLRGPRGEVLHDPSFDVVRSYPDFGSVQHRGRRLDAGRPR